MVRWVHHAKKTIKMSWGIRITIMYLGFVGLILTLVFTCFGHKVELESKDYYARELRFQDQINAELLSFLRSAPAPRLSDRMMATSIAG